jgi:hypothetical protein
MWASSKDFAEMSENYPSLYNQLIACRTLIAAMKQSIKLPFKTTFPSKSVDFQLEIRF